MRRAARILRSSSEYSAGWPPSETVDFPEEFQWQTPDEVGEVDGFGWQLVDKKGVEYGRTPGLGFI